MSNTFDFRRFRRLMRDDLATNFKRYALVLGATAGVMLLLFVWLSFARPSYQHVFKYDPMWDTERSIFWIVLFVGGFRAASNIMSPLSQKASCISFLMRPASDLEKFLSRFVVYVVGFVLAYFLVFEAVDLVRVAILRFSLPQHCTICPIGLEVFNPWREFKFALEGFFVLQSFYVLGGVLWPKRGGLKTTVSLILLLTLFIWILSMFFRHMLGRNPMMNAFGHDFPTISAIATPAICLVNYVLAYFRFKESEIIQRW